MGDASSRRGESSKKRRPVMLILAIVLFLVVLLFLALQTMGLWSLESSTQAVFRAAHHQSMRVLGQESIDLFASIHNEGETSSNSYSHLASSI